MEFAWLDVLGGRWLLLDGNLNSPARSWATRDAALAQLKEEGWTVTGPHPNRKSAKKKAGSTVYGYAMVRTVH